MATKFSVAGGVRVGMLGVLAAAGACNVQWTEGEGSVDVPLHQDGQKVVYGTDNRLDVYAHPDAALKARAQQSTVALMSQSSLNARNANNVTFNAETLGTAYNLCSSQRFRADPTAAFCSGTLIDDDLVLTAGHCVTNASECADTRFVFNYYRTSATGMQTVTSQDVFSCRSIVVREQSVIGGRNLDFAILRLDRTAAPRFTPAPVRTSTSALSAGQVVAVIGSGSGIPFKIDNGGKVRDARSSTQDYFLATTDTFGGNSGSGVYETATYTVAGILVRGDNDYVASGNCNVVNVCAESGCQGEEITYVRNAVESFCAANSSQRLCGSSGSNPGTPDPGTGTTPSTDTSNSYSYTASNTANATVSTVNRSITLAAGQTLTVGTCGVPGAAVTGDSFLRLLGPAGGEVANNDDACGGRGSQISFTATAAGSYQVKAGCYAAESCGGTVAWTLTAASSTPAAGSSGSFTFTATNTNNAKQNTVNRTVSVTAGQTLTVGTCGVTGATVTGDSYLRLYGGTTQVASNDDACGGQGSVITYTATAAASLQVRAGCYGSGSCSGTVAWTLR